MEKSMNQKKYNEERAEALSKIKQVIVSRLNLKIEPDFIDDDSPLFGTGLGLDSIDALELIVGIEDAFGITIESEDIGIFLSVNSIADYVLLKEQKKVCEEIEKSNNDEWINAYKNLRENFIVYHSESNIIKVDFSDEIIEYISKFISGNDIVLEPGRAIYTSLLNDNGQIIDFVYVMMFEDFYWFLPSRKESNSYIISELKENGFNPVEINDVYNISLDGPYCWKLLKNIAGYEITGLNYLHFMNFNLEEKEYLLFRAGVTNEYGFKIFVKKDEFENLFKKIKDESNNLNPCYINDNELKKTVINLATKEVRFPVLENIYNFDNSPLENELKWMIDLQKKDFKGKNSIIKSKNNISEKVIAFVIDTNEDNKLKVDDKIYFEEEELGKILNIQYSPSLRKRFGYAIIKTSYAFSGAEYMACDCENKKVLIRISSTPLFLTKSAVVQME